MFVKGTKQQQESVCPGNKVVRAVRKTIFWVLSAFLIICGLVYMPSFVSILFFVATAFIIPIDKLQNALIKVFPKKFIKGTLCWILVFVAILSAPTDKTTTPDRKDVTTSAIEQHPGETVKTETAETDTAEAGPMEADTIEAATMEAATMETGPMETDTAEALPVDSTFEIHYIDVGQADAALVLCDGKAMLIDGGNKEDSSLIYSYLKSNSVSHLDYIVATHGHEDHVGGLAGALNYATVDTAYCSVSNYDSEAFRDFVKYLNKQEKEITIPNPGDTFALGSAAVQIVAVNSNASDANNSSIILRIVYGETSFLFTGDAGREAEQMALDSGYSLESTVLKVGHHGSKYSTEYVFLRQVAPEYAVISLGEDNTYGYPTEDVLSRLRDAEVKTFRTDLQGTIVCVSDGTKVDFTVSKNADADTLAPAATMEQLQDVVKKSVDRYSGSYGKKLEGRLSYQVVSKTEVQLTYDAAKVLDKSEEYLVEEAMQQILDFVLADILASAYSKAGEVHAEITVNYEIDDGSQAPTNEEPQVVGTDYIGNKNSKKFHYTWCNSVKSMKENNKYYYTGTRDEMIAKGYVPCKNCNP